MSGSAAPPIGAGVRPDRAGEHLQVGKASTIERFQLRRDPQADRLADRFGHGAVDDDCGDVDHRSRRDRGLSYRIGGVVDPALERLAEVVPGVGSRQIDDGSSPAASTLRSS